MVLLALESENGAVLTYRVNKSQFTVGSSSRNDIVVRAPGIAERHLVMQRSGASFTFVTADRQTVVLNGERRARGVLNPGDRVRLGAMTLVFRGADAAGEPVGEEAATSGKVGQPAGETPVFLSDPAGFAVPRAHLLEALDVPRSDCLQRVVGLLREAVPAVEIAVLVLTEGSEPVPLASVWTGPLPRVAPEVAGELSTPGRYVRLGGADGATTVVPVLTPAGEVVAMLAARPGGALGSEALALLFEASRLLGLRWREVGRAATTEGGWEESARQRLEVEVPGSSQAVQILRAAMLAAAYRNDPVLVCGAEGVGRTEAARLLAELGPRGGGAPTIVDGRDGGDALRQRLFGPSGHASLASLSAGDLGALVVRDVDTIPLALQGELAALMSAQRREAQPGAGPRWFATCGEDPLALVQQGKLAPAFFQVVSPLVLRVPRLAERRGDLPLLIAGLIRRVAREQGKQLRGLTLECLNSLLAQPFQGEMAELVAEVNRLVSATPDGEIVRCEHLAGGESAVTGAETAGGAADVLSSDNLKVTVPRVERLLIDRVMRRAKGNQSLGAKTLGISRGALIAKLKEYGIPDYRHLKRKRG